MMMRTLLLTAVTALGALAVTPAALATGANSYELSVYGMVCNQCAYGVEQAVQHTGGVQDATVNLREGFVRVTPQAGMLPDPQAIADRITNQRVSISRFGATLRGRVVHAGDGWRLVVGGRHFALEPADGVDLAAAESRTVTVRGLFTGVAGVDGTSGTPERIGPGEPVRFVVEEVSPG